MKLGAISLAAAAIALIGVWVWVGGSGAMPSIQPAQPQLTPTEQRVLAERMAARVAEREHGDPHVRTEVPRVEAVDAGQIRVRVIDGDSGQALGGARAFDMKTHAFVGSAGADGTLVLPVHAAGRFAFAADGYLAKLPEAGDEDDVALMAAREKGSVLDLRLRRDKFTLPATLRFLDQTGAPLSEPVRFTIRCRDEPPPTGMSFPTARLAAGARVDRDLATAWQRHVAVRQMMDDTATLHLGVHSHGYAFTAPAGLARVQFVAAGAYQVAAVALGAALAGERDFQVTLGEESPIEVRLRAGRFAQGVVVDASDGQPISGAQVRLQQQIASPSSAAQTGLDGSFRIGPVTATQAVLQVQSRRHIEVEVTVTVGDACRIALTARPLRSVRGVVRQRPTAKPLPGVEVLIRSGAEVDAAGKTDTEGRFALETAADAPELVVRAQDYLPWLERIDEPQDSYTCDLLLADANARVQIGLTALLDGRVLGGDGQPAAGIPVQLFTDTLVVPEGIAGRAILEGHVLPLRPLTISGADGSFSLEWHHAGVVRLLAVDGVASSQDGVPVTVVLGQHVRDLVLRVGHR